MHRFVSWLSVVFFLCAGLACKQRSSEQIIQDHKEADQQVNQIIARHNPFPGVMKPNFIKTRVPVEPAEDDFGSLPDDVDVDGEENGTAHAFLFDDKVCFSKEKFAQGKKKCMDLKTGLGVSIDASQISIPDDVYVDIPPNASIHIFSFQGKTCIAKNKYEKGLMKCWDPEKMENVSIDTR